MTRTEFSNLLYKALIETANKGLKDDKVLLDMFKEPEDILELKMNYTTVGQLFGLNMIQNIQELMEKYYKKKENNEDLEEL